MARRPVRLRIGVLSLLAGLMGGTTAWSQPEERSVRPATVNAIVQMAVVEAQRRLADPECARIYTDFEDLAERPLQEKLDELGESGSSYLAGLRFVDFGGRLRCARPEVQAFTVPGSRVVFYCGQRFTDRIRRVGPGPLAVVLIHEELHSLGLGENPPSSLEITRRVERRCGS
jgi:hypothetical protein